MRFARSAVASLTLAALVFAIPVAWAPSASASWLGKRDVIAVSAPQKDGDGNDVYLMSKDGVKVDNLTAGRVFDAQDPTFSPEGGPHVAFVSGGDIFVIDRDTAGVSLSHFENLTHNDAREFSPHWSPAGGKLVYVRIANGVPEIWIMSLSGLNQEVYTCCRKSAGGPVDQKVVGTEPAWSPDIDTLAIVRTDQSNNKSIWLYAVDRRTLPRVLVRDGDQPNWAPCCEAGVNQRIAYVNKAGQLLTVDVVTGQTKVIDTPPKGQKDQNPAFSPDMGGVITFDRDTGVIYSVDPDVASPRASVLSSSTFKLLSHADWQPQCDIRGAPDANTVIDARKLDGPLLLCGKRGNDTIYGTNQGDRIFAGAGDDKVFAGAGDDFALGGLGGDSNYVNGGFGDDHLEGGIGDDTIVDHAGSDVIEGQAGNDVVVDDDGDPANSDKTGAGLGRDTCTVDNAGARQQTGPPPIDFIWDCETTLVPRIRAFVAAIFG